MSTDVRTLAELLYVELVGRSQAPAGAEGPTARAHAEGLAKTSIDLADTFYKVKKQSDVDAIPTGPSFDFQAADIAAWGKK